MQNGIVYVIIFKMNAVEFQNVNFSYKQGKPVVKNLSFEVKKGEFVCFVGRNGSGKSTTAKLINRLLKKSSGKIFVCGLDADEQKNLFEIRAKAGMVFQNPDNQSVATIVEDDVAFGPENLGVPRDEIEKRIDFALSATDMKDFASKTFSRLSGGQKQRVAIASALAMKPEILILDESTSMLDPKGRKEVLAVVEKLRKEEGLTVILITHYMEETVLADRIFVFYDGEIVKSGTPEQVFTDEDVLNRAGLKKPVATTIADELRLCGVDIPVILTEEELKTYLCKLLQNN